jgi:hypothetical protein
MSNHDDLRSKIAQAAGCPILSTNPTAKNCENGSTDKAAQTAPLQESHEWREPPVFRALPASPESRAFLKLPESPYVSASPVSPVSQGQAVPGDIEQELKKLAACKRLYSAEGCQNATIQVGAGNWRPSRCGKAES